MNNNRVPQTSEVLGIYLSFSEALDEVKKLTKKYHTSTGVKRLLEDGKMNALNPWYDYKDSRWEIQLCNVRGTNTSHAYICMRPYAIRCESYSEKSSRYTRN